MNIESDRDVIEFLKRIDTGLAAAEAAKEDVRGRELSWLPEKYTQLVLNLRAIRETAASGKMPRPSLGDIPVGAGLALGKSAGEWCNNEEVIRSLSDIEDYYRYRF